MRTRQDPSTKPYFRCLTCPRFRKLCGGRPTRDMNLDEWCEYMRDVKETFHLTNAFIAQESEVSLTTIENIIALNIKQDIMRSTARRIELVVIGPVRDHICYLDYDKNAVSETISKLQAEAEYWKKENDRKAKIIDKYLD